MGRKLVRSSARNRVGFLIFACGFAVVGMLLIRLLSAAGVSVDIQPEVGTQSSSVLVKSDSSVSGGKYIQFGDAAASGLGKLIVAQGNGFGSGDFFQNAAYDFNFLKQGFNTVLVNPGDPALVTAANNAGLKTVLEFDYKWDYIAAATQAEREQAIKSKIDAIIAQIKASPDAVFGVHMADRLNSWANDPDGTGPRKAISPAEMVDYLRLTGGRIHTEVPGIFVFIDVEDHNLTCDQTGQASCSSLNGSTSMYRYETNEVLTQLKNSGYLDGMFIANNISNDCTTPTSSNCWEPTVQRQAWTTARSLLPKPFIIVPRTSRLSFSSDTYENNGARTAQLADRQVAAAISIPIDAGSDGADLWGWHIDWSGTDPGIRTWMNKDANNDGVKNDPATNVLWDRIKAENAKWPNIPLTYDSEFETSQDTVARSPALPSQLLSVLKHTITATIELSKSVARGIATAVRSTARTISSSIRSFAISIMSNVKPKAYAQTASSDPVIVAVGDIAGVPGCTPSTGSNLACQHKLVSDLAMSLNPTAVLALGDLQYEDGTLAQFNGSGAFNDTWGRMKSIMKPVPGNHEYHVTDAKDYFDYFNGAGNATGQAGDRTKGYYSYNIGKWHIIALNTNLDVSSTSTQVQWLRADLAANSAVPCTLAYFHQSRFSSGGGHTSSTSYQDVWQALYDNKADVVLSGHSHIYERFAPQTPQGTLDQARGIRQFTVGTGGDYSYMAPEKVGSEGSVEANSEKANVGVVVQGVLKLVLHDGSYDWDFKPAITYPSTKTFSDTGSGTCVGAPTTPTPPPAPDTIAPIVSITSPTNNQSIGGTTTITASASDNTTVKQVEFFDGTTSLGVDTTAPYSANFSTVGFPNGSTHSLKAVATDTATTPNSTTSSVVTVTINNACQMPAATYGVTTVTVTVPSPGTYTVWSLMRAPDSANNAYYFNADLGGGQSICPMVIGDGALTANQWAWVNYKNGSTSDKATITFTTAGTHTVTLTGKEQGVALDRIMLLSDACVPTNLGNNCIQSTTPPPTPSPTPTPPPPAPNPTPAPKAGDVNGNGTIDLTDFFIMRTNFGQSGRTRAQGDLTGDGMVTLADFFILRQNFGK